MDLDLKSLELFVRVAAVGAIGKAGAELGMSSTSATERIKELEASLGTQLFHRTTRSVSLSTEGEVFLPRATRILEDLDAAVSDLQRDPGQISGELRLAASASFGRKYLTRFVAEFMQAHPRLSVQLHLSDATFDLVENGYDLAIRLGVLSSSSLKARRIGESQRILVATPGYLDRCGVPATPADLGEHNCLIRADVRTWSHRGPDRVVEDIKVCGNFGSNLAEAITEAALSGIGIARKCRWEVAEHLASGDLLQVLPEYRIVPEWQIHAVRPPARTQPERVRLFTEFITAKLKEVPELAPT